MEYDFPAWYYSSAFGGVQTFPPWEERGVQESRKQKRACWPGASWPPPALPHTSKRRWQPAVLCWLVKPISERQGDDAPRSREPAKRCQEERRGETGEVPAPRVRDPGKDAGASIPRGFPGRAAEAMDAPPPSLGRAEGGNVSHAMG